MEYLFEAILALLGVVITYYLVPWLKAKLSTAQQATVDYWVGIAVTAAEQIFGSGTGSEKLVYVQEYLATLGITVTTEEIESAVYWLADSVTSGD